MSKSNEELISELIDSFIALKQKMEDPSYIHLETSIQQLIKNQEEMKKDMADLKVRLLNPYDGAIVEIRKNTEFRQSLEKKEKELESLIDEHKSLMRWKNNAQKIGIAILSSIGAVLAWFLSEFLGR
jgi:Fe2+ transport system protein B